MMHIASRRSPRPVVALPLALGLLLAATLQWHLPLMLWDHIDLVPIYDAWRRGDLAASQFWRIHDGSHFHSAAYAVLLATTWLSGRHFASVARGVRIVLTIDEAGFVGNGIAAFAAVMDRFFGLYVHANSFTQLDILSATNGDILVSCKPRSGESILA